MSDELTCPYCGEESNVPDECYDENGLYDKECPHCLKTFGFTVYYIRYYSEHELPCANGEPHDYQPIHGWPAEVFAGRLRCRYCGDEITEKNPNKATEQPCKTTK